MSEKHILFLVPIHNEAKGLSLLLESFLSQTYIHFTVLIADNASTDSSREIVKKYSERDSRIRYVFYDEFVSSTASFKRAVQLALDQEFFNYIQFVGGDDSISNFIYLKDLENLLDSNLDLIFPKFKRDVSQTFSQMNFVTIKSNFRLYCKMCANWDAVLTISAVYKRDFFNEIANKYFARMQLPSDDWWLSFDVLSEKPRIGFADNAVYYKNQKKVGYKSAYHLGNSKKDSSSTNSKYFSNLQTVLYKTIVFPLKHHAQRRRFFQPIQLLWVPLGVLIMSVRYFSSLIFSLK